MPNRVSEDVSDGIIAAVLKIGLALAFTFLSLSALFLLFAFHDDIPKLLDAILNIATLAAKRLATNFVAVLLIGASVLWAILKLIDYTEWRSSGEGFKTTDASIDSVIDEGRNLPTSVEEDRIRIENLNK